jgi:hypothetical protein
MNTNLSKIVAVVDAICNNQNETPTIFTLKAPRSPSHNLVEDTEPETYGPPPRKKFPAIPKDWRLKPEYKVRK